MRAFAPASVGNLTEFYASNIERRLAQSGEYVRHLPTGAAPQWVVMNYQYIPTNGDMNVDYVASGANPKLFGYLDHFATKPELYRDGDSIRPARGSQFEVSGLLYNVKKVDVNHVGYLHIHLVLADNCSVVRPEFFEEYKDLLCDTIPECP